jgi:hypothetical protein
MRNARFTLFVLFGAVLAALLFSPRTPHTDTYLLMAEYGLLLPAVVLGLRAIPRANGGSWTPVPPMLLTLALFFSLNLTVRSFITQDVAAGDDGAYHFQARLFATGMVAAEAPPDIQVGDRPLRALFRFHHHAIVGDRWLTQYPPGWPALLSLAWRARLDWLLNPLLGGWILLMTWRIGCLLYTPRTGELGAAIAALSLFFQHSTSGYSSHPSCGAFLITAVYFYLRGRQDAVWRHFTLSLLCIAGASFIRPYTGFCAGAVLGVLLLAEARKRGILVRFLILTAALSLVGLGGYLGYNLYAHGRLSSYSSAGWSAREIFVANLFELLQSVAMFTRWSFQSTMMYGFPFLLPLAAHTLLADREHRLSAWMLAALFLSVVAGYSVTKLVSGAYFGERYYYETYFALCILAGRGLLLLVESRSRAVIRAVGPALLICLSVYGVHAALYAKRASYLFDPYAAVRDVALQITERNSVVYLPVNLGREINLNAPDWKQAPAVYLEDPGESLRAPVTGILGRRAWYVITYDPASRKASVLRQTLPSEASRTSSTQKHSACYHSGPVIERSS